MTDKDWKRLIHASTQRRLVGTWYEYKVEETGALFYGTYDTHTQTHTHTFSRFLTRLERI